MEIRITEIGNQVIDFRVAVRLSNGATILVTPRCLADLNWKIGDVLSR